MGEVFIGIFIFIALVGVAMTAFTVWAIVMVIKLLVRAVNGPKQKQPEFFMRPPATLPAAMTPPPLKYFPVRQPQPPTIQWTRCPRERCRTPNPGEAQFCRRCGMNLVAAKVAGQAPRGRELARA